MKFVMKSASELIKERGLQPHGRVQCLIDSEVLRRCSHLVPFREGELERSGIRGTVIGSGEVCYNAPYARYQYYGKSRSGRPLKYNTSRHTRAGAFWFERMKNTDKEDLLRMAQEEADK